MDITAPIRPPEQQRRRRRGSPMLRFFGFLFGVGMILFVAASAAAAFVLWKVSKDLPDYEVLSKYEPAVMTRIHANDGSLIAEYARERRIYVPFNAIPDCVINAFLSAEDKNFYQHGGIDIQGILRALVANVNNMQSGRRVVGASTITQQVAKNFLLTNDVTMERKLREAILSIRIERAFTKEQILELYLNEIFLGMSSYGVAAAALNYWGKALNELTLGECAYLAALPKGPNNYHPFKFTERAIGRRNWVIDRMVENGFAKLDDGEKAKALPLDVSPRQYGSHIVAAEFFAEEVRRELQTSFGEDKLYGGGLSVRTTLDPDMQKLARKSLVDGLVDYDKRHGYRGAVKKIDVAGDWGKTLADVQALSDVDPWRLAVVLSVSADKAVIGLQPGRLASGKVGPERDKGEIQFGDMKWARPLLANGRLGKEPKNATDVVAVGDAVYVGPAEGDDKSQFALMQKPGVEGALVAMDPHTGRVLAIVGGFSYAGGQFDRAVQARRQPGSSFKPFVYTAALDNGYTPSSIVIDAPVEISQGPGLPVWRPKNYEAGKSAGPSTLRFGVEKSRNQMTVRLAQDLGMPLISEYARRFGIYDNLVPMLSMALGAGETTLLQMTTGYAMIANGGKQVKSTLIDRIQDRYGRTIWRHDERDCDKCGARSWEKQDEPELVDARPQIVDPQTAYQITSVLEGVVQRGTGVKIKAVGKPLAGKTGTTNDEKDAWFIGFSPDLVVGVFVGYDSPKPMGRGETGGGIAAPIFRDFMKVALADKPAVPFRAPPGIKLVRVNLKTGLRASAGDPSAIMEVFKPGTEPADSYAVSNYDRGGDVPGDSQYDDGPARYDGNNASRDGDAYDDGPQRYDDAPPRYSDAPPQRYRERPTPRSRVDSGPSSDPGRALSGSPDLY